MRLITISTRMGMWKRNTLLYPTSSMKHEDIPTLGFISEPSGRRKSKQMTKTVSEAARPQAKMEKRMNLETSELFWLVLALQMVQQRSRQKTVIHPNMEILTK